MSALKVLGTEPIVPKKPAVDPSTLTYKDLLRGPFWQRIPAYASVPEEQFLDHNWQAKNTITNPQKLLAALQSLVSPQRARGAVDPRLRLPRVAARARGHRHLRRRRLPAPRFAARGDRRRVARDPERPAYALRDEGPCGDAAEDPHRPRVDGRAHAH